MKGGESEKYEGTNIESRRAVSVRAGLGHQIFWPCESLDWRGGAQVPLPYEMPQKGTSLTWSLAALCKCLTANFTAAWAMQQHVFK